MVGMPLFGTYTKAKFFSLNFLYSSVSRSPRFSWALVDPGKFLLALNYVNIKGRRSQLFLWLSLNIPNLPHEKRRLFSLISLGRTESNSSPGHQNDNFMNVFSLVCEWLICEWLAVLQLKTNSPNRSVISL